MEKIGEKSSRNIYKGHIDKANGGRIKAGREDGWGGREWWEKNGDNCARTTIRKLCVRISIDVTF